MELLKRMISKVCGPNFRPRHDFYIELFDKEGKLKYREKVRNGIVNEGKNDILDVYFSDGSQTAASSWYIGLVDNSGYVGVAAGDTAAQIGGSNDWNEFTTYSEANRVAWGPGAPSSQSISNASPATFNINGSGTVKGVFVITNNTKSGTTGTLWATALFSADVPVSNGDQLKVTYTVSC